MVKQIALLLICIVYWNPLLRGAEPDVEVSATLPGVRISIVAEHPDLATPTGIDVDDQGRIWVVATHTHMRPDDYVGPEHDEILVFDVSQNGSPVRQQFYNATTATMDLELGLDGWVYLAERDRILRIKDDDGDGTADVEQDLVVLKTEADYPHNGLSGLSWHPDGDLVFGLGENFATPWTLTGPDGTAIQGAAQGGVFRCSADGTNLRWIAKGLWNPFGTCVREDGEIFAADNDPGERPPCRLLHIIEGGEYGYRRQYGHESHHPFVCWNGELPGTLPMMHPTGEAPCGVVPLGRGLLVPSWGDHRIDFLPLKSQGASFTAALKTIAQGGRYFRPTCIARDPTVSGKKRTWYLADWVDGRYNSHGYGRLWKLEIDLDQATWLEPLELNPPTAAARQAIALRNGANSMSTDELFKLASDEDPFIARSAMLALSRRANRWTPQEIGERSVQDRAQAAMALEFSQADAEKWLPVFFNDSDQAVRFQALRWIAENELHAFLPDVEALLNSNRISYTEFEATLATWNTLQGKPEAGIRDVELLLNRVRDNNSSPRLRAYALRLLPTQSRAATAAGSLPAKTFPSGLTLDVLNELLELNSEELSLEVVRAAAGNPQVAQRLLLDVARNPNRSAQLRAEAIAGLAAVAGAHIDELLSLAADHQPTVRHEALRSLRSISLSQQQVDVLRELQKRYPESDEQLAAVLKPASLKTNRPAATEIQAWLELIDNVPGPADIDNGSRVFHHAKLGTCSHCHRHNGRGNVVGPDLTRQSQQRATREALLTSILQPSREIAPEFQPRTIVLNDGRTFTGIRLRSYTKEQIRDAHGQTRTFDKGDVELIQESNVSFMPAGLVDMLTNREIRDLLAFLANNENATQTDDRNFSLIRDPKSD